MKIVGHSLLWPFHCLVNGVLDLDLNWPLFRDYYRWGLAQAFLYKEPSAGDGDTAIEINGGMGFLSPLVRSHRPFWIINCHLALGADPTSQHRNRSGDAFELTPLRAGADAVGYVEVPSLECKHFLKVFDGLGIRGIADTKVPGESERMAQAKLQQDTIRAFNDELKGIISRRLETELARSLIDNREGERSGGKYLLEERALEIIKSSAHRTPGVMGEVAAPIRSGPRASLTAQVEYVLGTYQFTEELDRSLKAAVDISNGSFWSGPREKLHDRGAGEYYQTLFEAAVRSATESGLLTGSARKALLYLSTLPDIRRAILQTGERFDKNLDLQLELRKEIESGIQSAMQLAVKRTSSKLESDPEVKRLAARVLKALLPDVYALRPLASVLQTLRKDGSLSSQARADFRMLRHYWNGVGKLPHWAEIVQRNRRLLMAAFPEELNASQIDWMAPAYGIAMSGAAVDSQSLKEGTLLRLGLKALNYDLGYFVDGWSYGWVDGDGNRPFPYKLGYYASSPFPIYQYLSFLSPALGGFDFGASWHDHTQWAARYRLTDGGHFENLGVYALVRRGCRLIIVSDGAADPGANGWDSAKSEARATVFEDLRELEKKLQADFGATVEMEWEQFRTNDFPWSAHSAFGDVPIHTVFLGHIRNLPAVLGDDKDDIPVTIVYFKAAYNFDERLRNSLSYIDFEKTRTPEFPHEPTAHQFYSELKVLAYRGLGLSMVLASRDKLSCEVDTLKRNVRPTQ